MNKLNVIPLPVYALLFTIQCGVLIDNYCKWVKSENRV